MALNLGSFTEGATYAVLNEVFAEFRSDKGFARPSRYEVLLIPPNTRSSGSSIANIFQQVVGEMTQDGTVRQTGLRCEAIAFPGRTIDVTTDENIYGPVRSLATGYTDGDLSATFQCSSDMKEKKLFESWQRLAYNPQTWSMGYYDNYTGAIQINQLDEQNRIRYGVQCVECFPKDIQQQALSYAAATSIHKISVTFTYRYWKAMDDEANLPVPLQDRIAETLLNTVERQVTASLPKVISKLG